MQELAYHKTEPKMLQKVGHRFVISYYQIKHAMVETEGVSVENRMQKENGESKIRGCYIICMYVFHRYIRTVASFSFEAQAANIVICLYKIAV